MSTDKLSELRAEIDAYDDQIIGLLARRYAASDAIGHIKVATGLPIPHPERQQHRREVLAALAKKHDLDHATVVAIYDVISRELVVRHRKIAAAKAA